MKRKFLLIVMAIVTVATAVILSLPSPTHNKLFAATGDVGNLHEAFAQRYVMDDLRSATMDGRPFDIRNYQPQANGRIQLIHFVEFGFSFHPEARGEFGLFIYIFNPGRLDFAPHSTQNQIQMAFRQNNEGLPIWEKFRLRYLNSSTGNIAGLFSKFQIDFTPSELAMIMQNLNTHERVYDMSGIEFTMRPEFRIRDFEAGFTYTFTGFAKGFGVTPDDQATITSAVTERRTLPLRVTPTWWRSGVHAERGVGWHHQVNSVWFSVPNYILELFGRLQRIQAEWWEYQTQPVIVTSWQGLYTRYQHIVGRCVWGNSALRYGLGQNYGDNVVFGWGADWSFNGGMHNLHQSFGPPSVPRIYYLFDVPEIRPLSQTLNRPVGGVSGERLEDWIFNYNRSFDNGHVYANGGRRISADLFTDTIDPHRMANGYQRGFNETLIHADDREDLFFYTNYRFASVWERLWGAPRHIVEGQVGRTVSPIEPIGLQDFHGSNTSISNRLMVAYNHVDDLRDSVNQANENDYTVFLFRFAVTDYFADWLTIFRPRSTWGFTDRAEIIEGHAYKAQQTIFLDFDIIHLDFYGDFGYYRIPVVSDPINIIPDIVPPWHGYRRPCECPWWVRFIFGVFGIDCRSVPGLLRYLLAVVLWVVFAMGLALLGAIVMILLMILKPIFILLGATMGIGFAVRARNKSSPRASPKPRKNYRRSYRKRR